MEEEEKEGRKRSFGAGEIERYLAEESSMLTMVNSVQWQRQMMAALEQSPTHGRSCRRVEGRTRDRTVGIYLRIGTIPTNNSSSLVAASKHCA